VVERDEVWAATHPPATAVTESGRDLPGWLRATLTDAAAQRSPAVIGRPPAPGVVAGLDPSGRRTVERIATSPTLVHTLDCDTTIDGGQGKAAVLGALTRTGGAGIHMVVIPIGPTTVAQAAEQPYQRYLRDQKAISDDLARRVWQPPPGSRVVLDGADHLDTTTLTSWLRTAARHDLNLVLITDQAHPGPQRHLTDTLAAAAPWAAHHLDQTAHTRQHSATVAVGRLAAAHTDLIQAHHDAERAVAEHRERSRHQDRARDRNRGRDRGRDDDYDISL
jgi:hypothetical protein